MSAGTDFLATRKELAAEVRALVKQLNKALSRALEAGVQISIGVEGHPHFNVAVFGYAPVHGHETALADWATRVEVWVDRKRHPKGGDAGTGRTPQLSDCAAAGLAVIMRRIAEDAMEGRNLYTELAGE